MATSFEKGKLLLYCGIMDLRNVISGGILNLEDILDLTGNKGWRLIPRLKFRHNLL